MSVGLGATGLNVSSGLLMASDERAMQSKDAWTNGGRLGQVRPWEDGLLWSASRGMGGQAGGLFGDDAVAWEMIPDEGGGQQRKKIIGTTKDSGGNALGSCTVHGFLTADDTPVGQVTSDSGGYYELPTSYTGSHYLVAYKAGSPNVAGTTINTITPT